jgi:hypothetical protein
MRSLTPLLVALLVLAACGTAASTSTDPGNASEGPVLVVVDGRDTPDSGGISVADAIGHQPTDDIVLVTGALFVDADGTVLLCDAIAESFPPQCGGERIRVEGLDLARVAGLQEANGVRWAEGVTLLGSVE